MTLSVVTLGLLCTAMRVVPALVSLFVAYRFKDIIKTIIAGVGTIAILYIIF